MLVSRVCIYCWLGLEFRLESRLFDGIPVRQSVDISGEEVLNRKISTYIKCYGNGEISKAHDFKSMANLPYKVYNAWLRGSFVYRFLYVAGATVQGRGQRFNERVCRICDVPCDLSHALLHCRLVSHLRERHLHHPPMRVLDLR